MTKRKRYVYVFEFLNVNPIGTDAKGERKVENYLIKLCNLLSYQPLRNPSAHLSLLYGLSAWVPIKHGGAIHLYAWDDRSPSFVSVDIVSTLPINKSKVNSFSRTYFSLSDPNEVSFKSLSPPPFDWKELAPDIHRQRMSLFASAVRLPSLGILAEFLPSLSNELDMVPLSTVFVDEHTAWMHWETSGCVVEWRNGVLSLDIYTCKRFDPQKALALTKTIFGFRSAKVYNY